MELKEVLLQALPYGMGIVNEKGDILFLNDRLKELVAEDAVGQKCWSVYKDDKTQCLYCPLKSGLEQGALTSTETFGVMGGRIYQIDHVGIKYHGENAILEIYRDVTRNRQSEDLIKTLSTVVEQAGDSVIITDPKGIIQYVNPAFELLTGYSKEEVIGQTPRILKSGEHNESYYRELWGTILSGQTFRSMLVNQKKNGELFHVVTTITPLLNSKGEITHFVSTDKDITYIKKMEQEIAREQMKEEKLEAIKTLSVTYAHNILNAITPAHGHAERLLKRGNLPKEDQIWLEAILESTKTVVDVVNKLQKVNSYQVTEFGGVKILDLGQIKEKNEGAPC